MENPNFELLKRLVEGEIPYLKKMGLKVKEIKPCMVKMELPHNPDTLNYIGTAHAGAIFTFGETCGGALLGASFDLSKYYFVVKEAQTKYLKPVTGPIHAAISLKEEEAHRITEEIAKDGRSSCSINLSLYNDKNEVVAEMSLNYVLKRREEIRK